ncbi:MAG: hypothetical protein IT356_02035 [Gemmatimonadaceae bacterium]|nr:hypothetical protein [Gemmatimonadaceae bacterium]
MTRPAAWLESRWAPWFFGAVATACVWVTWESLRAWPILHDEWAYWTQAGQYAALRWTVPSPPHPEFFEQMYVLVVPVFAAKYWPGHAMAIAAGFAVGLPALVPILLSGVAGALVFLLARRVAGAGVAAVTFALWVSTFGNLRFRASYFSEVTTSVAWLAAWWALIAWRETRRPWWMAALAAIVGWGAITRPPTMFVFAIPVGVVVLRDVARMRAWRQLALGVAVGTAVLGILPLWSARVTGDWRVTPLGLYTRQYLPFDVPGYTVRDTPPERALPPEMERVRGFLRDIKAEQARAPAWRTFAQRGGFLLRDVFAGWRLPFAVAFAIGLAVAGPAGWFAIGTGVLLVLAYVTQAHTPDWTIYYLEAFPAVAFITALGVRRAAVGARKLLPAPMPHGIARTFPAVLLAVAAGLVARDVEIARDILARVASHTYAFRAAVERLPLKPNIVFVRYADGRNMHISLVANDGVPDDAVSWIVHDRGTSDLDLMTAAPGRAAYLYDEKSGEFREISR